MDVLEKSLQMLEKYALCDHCLGRQFAMLGHGMDNAERGKSIKTALTLKTHALALSKDRKRLRQLKFLATHGFSKPAEEILQKMNRRARSKGSSRPCICFLCEGKFEKVEVFAEKALELLEGFEHHTFLVGVKLPVAAEEREDEFKAEFSVNFGENMRNEFGRAVGKRIAEISGKTVDHRKPDVVVLVNPLLEEVRLQINPLYIAGRYKKLVRGIPQSRWLCSNCRGKGCKECNWTGKLYPESVEEIIGKPLLEATEGLKASFHGSGREDIDARMLGRGRPFVIEVTRPRRRFLDLKRLEKTVNAEAGGKVEVSNLKFADKDFVRKLKKAESAMKDYRLIVEFENKIAAKDLRLLEGELTNVLVKQKTPRRVLHRRADLTREKYIYDVEVKKLSPRKAEMKVRCQGGLYVKELVTGDDGRTTPSVSELLKNRAKPTKLDVLDVILGD